MSDNGQDILTWLVGTNCRPIPNNKPGRRSIPFEPPVIRALDGPPSFPLGGIVCDRSSFTFIPDRYPIQKTGGNTITSRHCMADHFLERCSVSNNGKTNPVTDLLSRISGPMYFFLGFPSAISIDPGIFRTYGYHANIIIHTSVHMHTYGQLRCDPDIRQRQRCLTGGKHEHEMGVCLQRRQRERQEPYGR